ncbi:uncharacterized protein LOC129922906 [Biomphalaria glabrata]|uniref:Uncharacterized protein LOC129922906 n=1 Tax=Biomphalaria glabrata TaxID=6526 RepID=A0A9W2YWF4_BIOGL|nr:uncharacterized protein LOC129922906 [Biomphalaria glabrata]
MSFEGNQSFQSFPEPQLMTESQRTMFVLVNRLVLCTAIGLFGLLTNLINMAVFTKLGFKISMNISLFTLSFWDFIRIILVQWLNVCSNPLLTRPDVPVLFSDVQYLTAGWPSNCAIRITISIAAYITFERCLGIMAPLKIRNIITPSKTVFILNIITIINIGGILPEYVSAYYDWKYNTLRNRTVLSLTFNMYRPATQGLVFGIHSVFIFLDLFLLIIFTSILVAQLRRKSKWRHEKVRDESQRASLSGRDKKTSKLVVLLATLLVLCYSPVVILSAVTGLRPDISFAGKESNLFHSLWSFAYLLGVFNASINSFIYYNMSSKYKEQFWFMFSRILFKTKQESLPRIQTIKLSSYSLTSSSN